MVAVRDINEIAKTVRRLRKAQGVSQTVLAQLSNVGLRFVRDVESGKESVHFGKLVSVLTTLGIELNLNLPSED